MLSDRVQKRRKSSRDVPKDTEVDDLISGRKFFGKTFGRYVVTIGNFPGGPMEQDDSGYWKIPVRVWKGRFYPESGLDPVEADEIVTAHEYLDPGPGTCFYHIEGESCKNAHECFLRVPGWLTAYLNERDLVRVQIDNKVMKLERRYNPDYWLSKEEILDNYCDEILGEPLQWWSLKDALYEAIFEVYDSYYKIANRLRRLRQ